MRSPHEFDTKLLYQKAFVDEATGAVNSPIHFSSTFHQTSFDQFGEFD